LDETTETGDEESSGVNYEQLSVDSSFQSIKIISLKYIFFIYEISLVLGSVLKIGLG